MLVTPSLLDIALRVHRQLEACEVGGLLELEGSPTQRIPPRNLTPDEQAVRRASLELLRNVLTGEFEVVGAVHATNQDLAETRVPDSTPGEEHTN